MMKYTRRLGATLLASATMLAACKGDSSKNDTTALKTDSTLSRDLAMANQDTAAKPQLNDVPSTSSSTKAPAPKPRVNNPPARVNRPAQSGPTTRPADRPPATPAPVTTASGNTATTNPGASTNPSSSGGGSVGTIPAGATLTTHANSRVCTNTNQVGDHVTASLENAVSGSNGATIPAGATLNLTVTQLKRSENSNDPIVMEFAVNSVTFGGRTYPIEGTVTSAAVDRIKDQPKAKDVQKVAVGAIAGAIAGKILGKSTKATVIGGAAGAAAGAATASATANYQGCVPSGGSIVVKLLGAGYGARVVHAVTLSEAKGLGSLSESLNGPGPFASLRVTRSFSSTMSFVDPRLTERRNPRTADIDLATPIEIVDLINAEDQTVAAAVATQREPIARAVAKAEETFRHGGRLFYVGAGTSGRLGVLDASECPPTYGTDPEMVQGIIAGGTPALTRSQEGAEDRLEGAVEDLTAHGVRAGDFVIGIAASGTTPYVRRALAHARSIGASTALVACSPPPQDALDVADIVILPITGPEVVTGSTRMKAGTATKLVLNMITTGAMIRLGKTFGNLMVDLRATNAKLEDRSERILMEVCEVSRHKARDLLDAAGGTVKTAIVMHFLGESREEAEHSLRQHGDVIRRVLDRPPPPVMPA